MPRQPKALPPVIRLNRSYRREPGALPPSLYPVLAVGFWGPLKGLFFWEKWCCWGGLKALGQPQKWRISAVFDHTLKAALYLSFVPLTRPCDPKVFLLHWSPYGSPAEGITKLSLLHRDREGPPAEGITKHHL